MELTAVILTKNEGKNIRKCIQSLNFCTEILVIDDNSSDNTVKIAKSLGVKVIQHALNRDFSTQKNYALSQASYKWVLFVDADERISANLRSEIERVITIPNNPVTGYFVRRKKILWGREVKFGDSRDYLLRLGKKSAGKWERKVHEYWQMSGKVEKLDGKIEHYPHKTLSEYISHVDFFSGLNAEVHYENKIKSNIFKIIIFPVAKFIQNYIFRLSIIDGINGFIISMMMSFHSFLSWSKLWFLQKHIEQ